MKIMEAINSDRLLPDQPLMRMLYEGKNYYKDLGSLMTGIVRYETVHDKFKILLPEGRTYESLGTEISTLFFYQMIIRLGGYKTVLELGTFIGVSAMFFSEMAEKVHTVEFGEEFYKIALKNINANKVKNISAWNEDAETFLKTAIKSCRRYDFIFLDAAKEKYDKLLPLAWGCLGDNGMIVVDDVFMQGDCINHIPKTDKGNGVKRMLKNIQKMKNIRKVILPIGDGILLIMRK